MSIIAFVKVIYSRPNVSATQFASPERGSTRFVRPAVYVVAALLVVHGVLILARCIAKSCLKTPVEDEFVVGPAEVVLDGADSDQHVVSCGPGDFNHLNFDALYEDYLLPALDQAKRDREAADEIVIPPADEEYEPFPVPHTPESVDRSLKRESCLKKPKRKANPSERGSRIRELAPFFYNWNPELWVKSCLDPLMDVPKQVQPVARSYEANKLFIKQSIKFVKDYYRFIDSCHSHLSVLKENILRLAPVEEKTRSEGRRSVGSIIEAVDESLKWLEKEYMTPTNKLLQDMRQVRSRRSRIFGIRKRDDFMSLEDLAKSVAQRIQCLMASRDPTALTVLLRISKIMEDMSAFAEILEYELRNPPRKIRFNDKLEICPVYTSFEMKRQRVQYFLETWGQCKPTVVLETQETQETQETGIPCQ